MHTQARTHDNEVTMHPVRGERHPGRDPWHSAKLRHHGHGPCLCHHHAVLHSLHFIFVSSLLLYLYLSACAFPFFSLFLCFPFYLLSLFATLALFPFALFHLTVLPPFLYLPFVFCAIILFRSPLLYFIFLLSHLTSPLFSRLHPLFSLLCFFLFSIC